MKNSTFLYSFLLEHSFHPQCLTTANKRTISAKEKKNTQNRFDITIYFGNNFFSVCVFCCFFFKGKMNSTHINHQHITEGISFFPKSHY